MRYSHSLKQYDLNSKELEELQKFLEQRNFKISDRCAPGMLGTSTIIDRTKKELSATKDGIIIEYPWGFGNNGLQVVADSRLEKVVKEYLGRS